MTTKKSFTDLARLEWYQVALTNAETKPEINQSLVGAGVSKEVLDEGIELHNLANKAYNDAIRSRKNRIEAYRRFSKRSEELEAFFSSDRKKAGIAFLNDELAKEKLELGRNLVKNRLKQFDMSRTFYNVLSENPDLVEGLSMFGISSEVIASRLAIISEIEQARASYIFNKGIAQNATKEKTKAIDLLSKWMTGFFSIARDVFKDEPQMMESLGIVVK